MMEPLEKAMAMTTAMGDRAGGGASNRARSYRASDCTSDCAGLLAVTEVCEPVRLTRARLASLLLRQQPGQQREQEQQQQQTSSELNQTIPGGSIGSGSGSSSSGSSSSGNNSDSGSNGSFCVDGELALSGFVAAVDAYARSCAESVRCWEDHFGRHLVSVVTRMVVAEKDDAETTVASVRESKQEGEEASKSGGNPPPPPPPPSLPLPLPPSFCVYQVVQADGSTAHHEQRWHREAVLHACHTGGIARVRMCKTRGGGRGGGGGGVGATSVSGSDSGSDSDSADYVHYDAVTGEITEVERFNTKPPVPHQQRKGQGHGQGQQGHGIEFLGREEDKTGTTEGSEVTTATTATTATSATAAIATTDATDATTTSGDSMEGSNAHLHHHQQQQQHQHQHQHQHQQHRHNHQLVGADEVQYKQELNAWRWQEHHQAKVGWW